MKLEKLAARIDNKKGYRDISLNIMENATSEKLTKGDLKKAGGDPRDDANQRQERIRWKYTPNS